MKHQNIQYLQLQQNNYNVKQQMLVTGAERLEHDLASLARKP
jgi:hypothetical protein